MDEKVGCSSLNMEKVCYHEKTARLLIVMSLVVIIIIAFSVFFYNPDKITPENPEGKIL